MTYDEFKNSLFQIMEVRLPEDVMPEMYVKKNNDVISERMSFRKKGEDVSVSSTLDLKDLYDNFQDFHGDMKDFVEKILKETPIMQTLKIDTDFIRTLNQDQLFVQVVNVKNKKHIMMDCPYQKEGDFLLTYRVLGYRDEIGMASCMVTNHMLEEYGITKEQLHHMAMANTQRLFPIKFEKLTDIIFHHPLGMENTNHFIDVNPEEKQEPYVLTNQAQTHGATVLFYPEVKEELLRQFPEGYYVLPSSTHEVLILSADTVKGKKDEKFLEETVRTVNRSNVRSGDVLSNYIYRVDKDSNCRIARVSLEQDRNRKSKRER